MTVVASSAWSTKHEARSTESHLAASKGRALEGGEGRWGGVEGEGKLVDLGGGGGGQEI